MKVGAQKVEKKTDIKTCSFIPVEILLINTFSKIFADVIESST